MTTLMPCSSLYLPTTQTYMFARSIDAADGYRQRPLASRMGLQPSRVQLHHQSRWHQHSHSPPRASLRKRQSEPVHVNLRRPTTRRRTAQTSRPLGPIVTAKDDAALAVPAFFHTDPHTCAIPAMSPHDGADAPQQSFSQNSDNVQANTQLRRSKRLQAAASAQIGSAEVIRSAAAS